MIRRLLFALLLLLCPALLTAQDTGWEITSFNATYRVNADRTIDVVELISVDFGALQKHGIYREIPIRYRRVAKAGMPLDAGRVTVDLTLRGVTNDRGEAQQVEVTRGERVRIRIGSPDVTVMGPQVYMIRYQLESGVGFFAGHDELYWQVTGTEWPVPIREATARVIVPAGGAATDSAWTAWCYAGWAESNSNERCTAQVAAGQEFTFASGRLDPGEGLTLVAGFPKGLVIEPTAADVTRERVATWWPVAVPFLIFLTMYRQWHRRGREPHVGSIVAQWKIPSDMRPGAAGVLLDQRADMDDIVATLLDLAVRGYIRIREVEPENILAALGDSFLGKALKSLGVGKNDWSIERTEKPVTDLLFYEREVLDALLEGKQSRVMSDLHNDFYKHLPNLHTVMYAEVVRQGWFVQSPEKVRQRWLVFGLLVLIAGVVAGIALHNAVLAIGTVLGGIVMIGFSNSMPAMTESGAKQWAAIKGLEEYIRRAEKVELESRQGPQRTTELFETLLPYAVALDASDIWVDQFASVLASTPPTWYVGTNMHAFNVSSFRSGLSGFQTAATRTMGSSPGSSSGGGGGGSVGGGGGGGGGGSW
jgi:hypothetical protein